MPQDVAAAAPRPAGKSGALQVPAKWQLTTNTELRCATVPLFRSRNPQRCRDCGSYFNFLIPKIVVVPLTSFPTITNG